MELIPSDYVFNNKLLQQARADSIRNLKINLMFVMKEIPNSKEFIKNYIATDCFIGLTRDEYANLQPNYEECIELFSKYQN